jgi:toxin YoeB
MSAPREAVCHPECLEDLQHWIEADRLHARQNPRRTARRLLDLMKAVLRDPFGGIGKPEPLKYLGPGVWSRRITQEHRCVYLVKADRIEFLQGRYHY